MAALVSDSRGLVYVSGAPGSGTTTLAVPLATELGCALLSNDRPVGVGTLVTVDTTVTVNVHAVAAMVRDCHDRNYRNAGAP